MAPSCPCVPNFNVAQLEATEEESESAASPGPCGLRARLTVPHPARLLAEGGFEPVAPGTVTGLLIRGSMQSLSSLVTRVSTVRRATSRCSHGEATE